MLLALSSLTTMGVVVPAVRTGASLTAVMLVFNDTVPELKAVLPPLADTFVLLPLVKPVALESTSRAVSL